MKTAVCIMAVTAVVAVAALPSGAADGRKLQFELVDGTVITGSVEVKAISIRVSNGNVLKVPVADLTELTVRSNKQAQPQHTVQAGKNTFVGTVTVKQFRIGSPYGHFTVKLDDIHRVCPGVQAIPGKFGRWAVGLRDKTRLRGMVISKSLSVQSRYGTAVVPFSHIERATFASDRKAIRVQCWGSDRIFGAIRPGTTISFKTNEGGVDLSAGKVAVVTHGPLALKGHSNPARSVAFSPDGKRLASASEDCTIKIWNTGTGKEVLTLKGHSKAVVSVAFSPDGKRLASGSWDDTVKIWDMPK